MNVKCFEPRAESDCGYCWVFLGVFLVCLQLCSVFLIPLLLSVLTGLWRCDATRGRRLTFGVLFGKCVSERVSGPCVEWRSIPGPG